jgi:hypothetical protein
MDIKTTRGPAPGGKGREGAADGKRRQRSDWCGQIARTKKSERPRRRQGRQGDRQEAPHARAEARKRYLAHRDFGATMKNIRDKAVALEHYARQAQNTDAERRACEIRLRAERKAGQLLAKQNNHGGDRRSISRSPETTLKDLGISRDQSSQWQKAAQVEWRGGYNAAQSSAAANYLRL